MRIERKEQGVGPINVLFTEDVLSDVPDSMEVTIPRGCVKEQLVNQQLPVFPEDKRYTIAKSIWERMDTDQQALTVLHEAWYRLTLDEGANDSRWARYMNGLFAAQEKIAFKDYLAKLTLSERIGSFGNKKLSYFYEINGNAIELIQKKNESQDELIIFERLNLTANAEAIFEGLILGEVYRISFNKKGKLHSIAGKGYLRSENKDDRDWMKLENYRMKQTRNFTRSVSTFIVDGNFQIIELRSHFDQAYLGNKKLKKAFRPSSAISDAFDYYGIDLTFTRINGVLTHKINQSNQ